MTLHVPIYNYLIVAHVNTRKGSDADLHPPASLSSRPVRTALMRSALACNYSLLPRVGRASHRFGPRGSRAARVWWLVGSDIGAGYRVSGIGYRVRKQ